MRRVVEADVHVVLHLSLKYRDPVIYDSIRKQLNEVRAEKTRQLKEFLAPLEEAFDLRGLKVESQIIERSTHSIWKRMQTKQLTSHFRTHTCRQGHVSTSQTEGAL